RSKCQKPLGRDFFWIPACAGKTGRDIGKILDPAPASSGCEPGTPQDEVHGNSGPCFAVLSPRFSPAANNSGLNVAHPALKVCPINIPDVRYYIIDIHLRRSGPSLATAL
ncbi:MAG: hypothetical protein AAGD92_16490, partial [Pseudomonadota bacterium]